LYTNIPFFIFYTASFIFLILAIFGFIFKKDKLFYFSFLIFCFFIAAGYLKNINELSINHINHILPEDRLVILKGSVISDPVYKKDKISFIFQTNDSIEEKTAQKISGEVLVNLPTGKNIFYGDSLILKGKIYKTSDLYFHKFLEQNQIYSILKVKDKKDIIYLGEHLLNPVKFIAYKIKHKLKNIISQSMPSLQAGFLNAILLGDRESLSKTLNGAFIKTGTAHIIAISGFNVGIVAIIFWILLKILGIKRKTRCFLIIFILIIYCILTGATSSVVRATIMGVILFLGYALEKDAHIYNSLALAALIILTINPNQLFDIGFQLSFLSVLAMVYLSPKIENLILKFIKQENYFLKNFIILPFAISLACWLVTSPIILFNFGIFSPITLLANLIIVPYVTLITAVGFVLILSGLILPISISIFALTEAFLIGILFEIVIFLSKIPGAYFTFH
ncbi:MAG: ComEC/Rec2 family competence protein, partial [Candidatus Omnitrophota bacterium]